MKSGFVDTCASPPHPVQISRNIVGRGTDLAGLAARTTGSFIAERVRNTCLDADTHLNGQDFSLAQHLPNSVPFTVFLNIPCFVAVIHEP